MSEFQSYLPYIYNNTVFDTATQNNEGFKEYILETENLSYQFANILVGTLPGSRYEYYANPNYDKIKRNVLGELTKIDDALGFYQP